jgi:hypothetical protein
MLCILSVGHVVLPSQGSLPGKAHNRTDTGAGCVRCLDPYPPVAAPAIAARWT